MTHSQGNPERVSSRRPVLIAGGFALIVAGLLFAGLTLWRGPLVTTVRSNIRIDTDANRMSILANMRSNAATTEALWGSGVIVAGVFVSGVGLLTARQRATRS